MKMHLIWQIGLSLLSGVLLASLGCFRSGTVWFVDSARVRAGLAHSGGGILRDVWTHRVLLAGRGDAME
jgi:hypothetical protein